MILKLLVTFVVLFAIDVIAIWATPITSKEITKIIQGGIVLACVIAIPVLVLIGIWWGFV